MGAGLLANTEYQATKKSTDLPISRASALPHCDSLLIQLDLRFRLPNADQYFSSTELHSVEHFLLEGFQRLLPEAFIGIGVMGCQTGFYLTLLNEGRRSLIEQTLENILQGMLTATEVPYARIDQCGRWENHDLGKAQAVAREVLAKRAVWQDIA